jgi:hypothetical protein
MSTTNPEKLNLSWLLDNNRLKKSVVRNLVQNQEVPKYVFGYSPMAAQSAKNFILSKSFPSYTNQILHKEQTLLSREVSFIRQRLDLVSKVNIFDVSETSGNSSLPFIFELLEYDMMGKYTPVTPNQEVNQIAIDTLKRLVKEVLLPDFETESILADAEISSFKSLVMDTVDKTIPINDYINLFLLTGSRLGNSHEPQKMLQNIYDSMNEGDCLAILQGLYRSGSEDTIVSDYSSIISNDDVLMSQKLVGQLINPEAKFEVFWDDQDVPGVIFGVRSSSAENLFEANLKENQTITLMRSSRFREMMLRDIILKSGFNIIDIAYDKNMDHGLFFLEK